ncbi:hypothetical protein PF005_g21719 [Phytophthora fragariae]|uniref:Retrotransposon gag domain-containing protein n=1 Tax=Phytophthora fragariae TaxID=53985 RepID=A0A6A3E0L9_9STRA|nr:hypothetical protein PF003_g13656 [Phytophthora fragariae]KAE8927479.1 hypothetical protein PF009_g22355 [Phytophthora fragariae]KAE9072826.1 hypothetical protein PF007_g26037 [Phytophthora fragariae]KAE9101834.1 hypothetical protein PF006_g22586 [Phytophthora fragariae]KAE9184310.1 hypothetical protein PF005_g21719 [Phytophthora fragariae]
MRILQPTQIGDQIGPVTAPATADNKLGAIKILMNLLQEAGLVAGAFNAEDLFRPDLRIFQLSTKEHFYNLKVIVGEKVTDPSTTSSPDSPTQIGSTGDRTSLPFVSAAEADSDSSSEPRRMSLGPAGAAMLHARSKVSRQKPTRSKAKKTSGAVSKPTTPPPNLVIGTDNATTSTDKMESYFQAAMSRFLRKQQISMPNLAARALSNPGTRNVEMESAGSDDLERLQWEYDPDDLDLPAAAPAAVATAAVGSSESTLIQRVRISAISDLKEFTGKDQDEDRARAWINKVKSSFMRDQASDEEKCLTVADLLSGPAKSWYQQLPRSTRNKWTELLKSFQIQYCGFGVSVARQYYQAQKRSDESASEYLHRLNVAGLRARLKVKDGNTKERKEHLDHFIETLGDPELADRLTLLRLSDADDLEEVLRALGRAKSRQKKSAAGPSRYRQIAAPSPAPAASAKQVRVIQIQAPDSESDSSLDGSDSDRDEHRRIYLAANDEHSPLGEEPKTSDREQLESPRSGSSTRGPKVTISSGWRGQGAVLTL